ncbi:MAG: aspartate dehydrogenase [Candidatus Micrarchaeota archaeon]|nr:aspartate dehydrogenase [Candidatus Micrarchaeota archaeon]
MKIGLIGFGAIGSFLGKRLKKEIKWVLDCDPEAKKRMRRAGLRCRFLRSLPKNCGGVDVVVEAASQGAVPMLASCLRHCDVMIMSVGALADRKLLETLKTQARRYRRKIYLPSGAIGGLDAVLSADGKIERVLLESVKDPPSLQRADVARKVVFEGSAAEACKAYPKNVNVAATLSIAGIGFERTRVRIISDPDARKNIHSVFVKGKTGVMFFKLENEPFAENPRTSALAAYSALAMIKKMESEIQIG